MSHPIPGHEYGENEYPEKGFRPVRKEFRKKAKKMARKSPKKDKGVDMTGFFRKMASEGKNPFKLVTHIRTNGGSSRRRVARDSGSPPHLE